MPDLTPKQERWCEEYLVDLNAAAAARRAGYSRNTATQIGTENLGKPVLQAKILELRKARSEKVQVDAERVLRELCLLGFSNMADFMVAQEDGTAFVDFSGLTRDKAAAIQEFVVEEFTDGKGEDARNVRRTKFKLADKKSALVEIGRHLGMFDDKLRLANADGSNLPAAAVFVMRVGDGA